MTIDPYIVDLLDRARHWRKMHPTPTRRDLAPPNLDDPEVYHLITELEAALRGQIGELEP